MISAHTATRGSSAPTADGSRSSNGEVGEANLEETLLEANLPDSIDIRPHENGDPGRLPMGSQIAPDLGEDLFVGSGKSQSELDLHPSAV